jgi:hypothetical protein
MRFRLLALVVAVSSLPTVALAQLAQGELRGTILDESGAVLPGVTVTALHVETGTSRTATTAANGAYLMPAMPLGTYKVTAEIAGFSTMVREGFRLGVGEAVTITFTMKVAALQESVTVRVEQVDEQRLGNRHDREGREFGGRCRKARNIGHV